MNYSQMGQNLGLTCLTQQEKGVGRKGFYGKNKYVSLGKTNRSLGEQIVDKKVCGNNSLCRYIFFMAVKLLQRGNYGGFSLGLSPGSRSQPVMGICGRPHFSHVSALSQIREAPRRFLHLLNLKCLHPKIIFMPQQLILGWHVLIPFKGKVTNQVNLFQIRNETWVRQYLLK